MRYSQVREEIYQLIKKNPGVSQIGLYKIMMWKRHYCTVHYNIRVLLSSRVIERVPVSTRGTFRLYLRGKATKPEQVEPVYHGIWNLKSPINKLHGEAFRFAFDEGYGLLYCDLMIIARGCYG